MARKFQIDDVVYALMLDGINLGFQTEKNGTAADTRFIGDNFWLQDTAVIENIEQRKGVWNIYLVFAHHLAPLKFIRRSIVSYSCCKRATLAAHYMRRLAAKDQRGTLTVNQSLVPLSFN
ncbi:MAG: hypothetical protein JNM68_04425 [Dinghuibacter sp.]|nr:hypothetical protein [Dinghuibacter sp.]